MTSIIAHIRSEKKDKGIKTKVKFQIRDKNVNLNYRSEIEICPMNWDQKSLVKRLVLAGHIVQFVITHGQGIIRINVRTCVELTISGIKAVQIVVEILVLDVLARQRLGGIRTRIGYGPNVVHVIVRIGVVHQIDGALDLEVAQVTGSGVVRIEGFNAVSVFDGGALPNIKSYRFAILK